MDLEILMEQTAVATAPPENPVGGIPKQWLPGLIRWPLRVLFLPFILLDMMAQKIARILIRPPFVKQGHCLKRGNCCHYILLPKMKAPLHRLAQFWYTQIDGFYLREKEPVADGKKQFMVMGCRYLKKDGSCGHYHLRPMICRQWPRIEYFGHPQILKGCGYKAVSRYK